MEYPFPLFLTAPHTPLHVPAMKTPPSRGNSKPVAATKQTAFTIILTIALFLWIIRSFSSTTSQLDRIPSPQHAVDE